MENYFVLGIRWSPGPEQPLDDVGFAHDEEEQNEAFETLQQLLDMEEREPEENEEDPMTSVAGPKRMELEMRQTHSPSVTRKMVVTSVVGPRGSFKSYISHGRLYKDNGELDKFITTAMNSDLWRITAIKVYPGGISSPVTSHYGQYSLSAINDPWEKASTYLEGLQPSELAVIKNWHPPLIEDDEDDIYGYGAHYTNRVPGHYQHQGAYSHITHTYKPPVGMLRTSGDDIGALIHKETCELISELPDDDREMSILEYLEKKDEAGTEEIPKVEISAKIDAATGGGGSSDVKSDSAIVFCDCNSPSCNACEEISLAAQLAGCGYTLH